MVAIPKAEKQIQRSEKRVASECSVRATLLSERHSGGSRYARCGEMGRSRLHPKIMKFCPNYRCAAYGRVVYTQSTRCGFCRWDLRPPRMKSETVADENAFADTMQKSVITEAPATAEGSPAHRKGSPLRHTA